MLILIFMNNDNFMNDDVNYNFVNDDVNYNFYD